MEDDSSEIAVITDAPANTNPKRRCCLTFVLLLFLFLLFFFLFLAVLLDYLSVPSPISFSSKCKIVSSGVDLRSSKVCELGFLNYKAKNVFYPYEKKKFRCRYDYYWASIFKVQYIDHSGRSRFALAETPNEALPLGCRPSFGAAWLTKDKFKVNESYDCWYTLGISEVNLHHGRFFNCQSEEPSTVEMLRRYSILFVKTLESLYSRRRAVLHWSFGIVAGVASGLLTALLLICFVRFIQMKSCSPRIHAVEIQPRILCVARLKHACFFVAYFSLTGWLALQYVKRLGLRDIFSVR